MTSINLESVKRAFEQWRLERRNSAEPIPDTLWSMALSLFPKHKLSHICRHLRLNSNQFKQRFDQAENCGGANEGFVLATHSDKQSIPSPRSNVHISISGARTLSISACVDDLEHIIPHIGSLL